MVDESCDLQRYAKAVLDEEVADLRRTLGANIVAAYLDVPEQRLIRMTVVSGVTTTVAQPWARVAHRAQVPVAEAVRTRRAVWVGDHEELARRFPRTGLSFPYPVAMYVAPFLDGGCWGAVLLLWPSTRAPRLTLAEEHAISEACHRVAHALRKAAEAGQAVQPASRPRALEPVERGTEVVSHSADHLSWGVCRLDTGGRLVFVNTRASELLGARPEELLGRTPGAALDWLADPALERSYLSALFSRLDSGIAVRHPEGRWLSFTLAADDRGTTVRIEATDGPDETGDRDGAVRSRFTDAPARAGALYHLLHLTSALTEATGGDEVIDALTEEVMPAVGAQALALLTEENGRLRVVRCRGFPSSAPEFFDGLLMTAHTEAVHTIVSGTASFRGDGESLRLVYPDIELYRDKDAFAFLPLTVAGRTIGCCVLGYDRPRLFTHDERAELTSLAGFIAQTMERANLYDLNARTARVLQAGLLPGRLPQLPGLSAAARYRPAGAALDVGGDFYDVIRIDATTAAAVVGDVQGHSVQAAALMGQIRTAVHAYAQTGAAPAEVLSRTNRFLDDVNTDLFASCIYVEMDLLNRRAVLAMAGHLPPVLRRPDGTTEVLDLPPGLLLGIEPDAVFPTTEIDLPSGSLLALYTDGLVERPGLDMGDAIDGLAASLADAPSGPLATVCDMLIGRADSGNTDSRSDDIALLLLEAGDSTR